MKKGISFLNPEVSGLHLSTLLITNSNPDGSG